MPTAALPESIHPSWVQTLAPVADNIAACGDFLRAELAAGRGYLPPGPAIMRAFEQPMDEVKVLILGQDPYPTPGYSIGLCFCVAPDVRPVPRSLVNIYAELSTDLGVPTPSNGDLTPWAAQGVLLLNRVLTVEPNNSGSHRRKGWEEVTGCAIAGLVARAQPLVAILWGRDAQLVIPQLGSTPYIASVHPSPLSARRGFFGSKPFSRANTLLAEQGCAPVDWSLV